MPRVVQILLICLVFHFSSIVIFAAEPNTNEPVTNKIPPSNASIKIVQAISISVEPNEWIIGCAEINKVLNYSKPNVNSNISPENPVLNQINSQDLEDIGCAYAGSTFTQNENTKIIVTNNGIGPEVFDLKLVDPPGWISSALPSKEIYVLSGIFCGPNDAPQKDDFNQDAGYEDVIFTVTKRADSTVFGYSQAAANGASVPSGENRSLYLQFKSPTVTSKTTEQIISVIISCEPDY